MMRGYRHAQRHHCHRRLDNQAGTRQRVRRNPPRDVSRDQAYKGFRNIRLLRSDFDPNHFMLIEEWDEAQNFHDYVQFRTDRGEMPGLAAMTVSPPQIGIWALDPLAAAQA